MCDPTILTVQYVLSLQENLLLRIFALLGPEQLEVAEQTTVLFRNFGELLAVLLFQIAGSCTLQMTQAISRYVLGQSYACSCGGTTAVNTASIWRSL